ncbi:hypothetical protein D8674_028955 [Pyrus ussuriensis x Pyrus communis]|uniref:Uncharacterized protein n=1 Tax=Pyrus ussuriensis x Pyrus communis TaxID=2448454 RepID=A0A5N5HYP0_9ROSA|nr:hypothetical protein D8674_028955 [Pyrus ussuriensis x Pyrus communis]
MEFEDDHPSSNHSAPVDSMVVSDSHLVGINMGGTENVCDDPFSNRDISHADLSLTISNLIHEFIVADLEKLALTPPVIRGHLNKAGPILLSEGGMRRVGRNSHGRRNVASSRRFMSSGPNDGVKRSRSPTLEDCLVLPKCFSSSGNSYFPAGSPILFLSKTKCDRKRIEYVKLRSWDSMGFTATSDQYKSWELLRSLSSFSALPWLIFRDFNEVLLASEKIGGRVRSSSQMQRFQDAVAYCNLGDLGFSVLSFLSSGCILRQLNYTLVSLIPEILKTVSHVSAPGNCIINMVPLLGQLISDNSTVASKDGKLKNPALVSYAANLQLEAYINAHRSTQNQPQPL